MTLKMANFQEVAGDLTSVFLHENLRIEEKKRKLMFAPLTPHLPSPYPHTTPPSFAPILYTYTLSCY